MGTITIVCGPPASGKSSYVQERLQPGDLIVDFDTIFAAFTGLPLYEKPSHLIMFAETAIRSVINLMEIDRHKIQNAWIIRSAPQAQERERLRQKLKAQVIILATPEEECCRRIDLDDRRSLSIKTRHKQLVREWWRDYRSTIIGRGD